MVYVTTYICVECLPVLQVERNTITMGKKANTRVTVKTLTSPVSARSADKRSKKRVTVKDLTSTINKMQRKEAQLQALDRKYAKSPDPSLNIRAKRLEDDLYDLDAIVASASDNVWDKYLSSTSPKTKEASDADSN